MGRGAILSKSAFKRGLALGAGEGWPHGGWEAGGRGWLFGPGGVGGGGVVLKCVGKVVEGGGGVRGGCVLGVLWGVGGGSFFFVFVRQFFLLLGRGGFRVCVFGAGGLGWGLRGGQRLIRHGRRKIRRAVERFLKGTKLLETPMTHIHVTKKGGDGSRGRDGHL